MANGRQEFSQSGPKRVTIASISFPAVNTPRLDVSGVGRAKVVAFARVKGKDAAIIVVAAHGRHHSETSNCRLGRHRLSVCLLCVAGQEVSRALVPAGLLKSSLDLAIGHVLAGQARRFAAERLSSKATWVEVPAWPVASNGRILVWIPVAGETNVPSGNR